MKTATATLKAKTKMHPDSADLNADSGMFRVVRRIENRDYRIGTDHDCRECAIDLASSHRVGGADYRVFNDKGSQVFPPP